MKSQGDDGAVGSADFDYRAVPRRTSPTGVAAVLIVGVVIATVGGVSVAVSADALGLVGVGLGLLLITVAIFLRRMNAIAAARTPPTRATSRMTSRTRLPLLPEEDRRLAETDAAARAEAKREAQWAREHPEDGGSR
jgi:hypothetical protein